MAYKKRIMSDTQIPLVVRNYSYNAIAWDIVG